MAATPSRSKISFGASIDRKDTFFTCAIPIQLKLVPDWRRKHALYQVPHLSLPPRRHRVQYFSPIQPPPYRRVQSDHGQDLRYRDPCSPSRRLEKPSTSSEDLAGAFTSLIQSTGSSPHTLSPLHPAQVFSTSDGSARCGLSSHVMSDILKPLIRHVIWTHRLTALSPRSKIPRHTSHLTAKPQRTSRPAQTPRPWPTHLPGARDPLGPQSHATRRCTARCSTPRPSCAESPRSHASARW